MSHRSTAAARLPAKLTFTSSVPMGNTVYLVGGSWKAGNGVIGYTRRVYKFDTQTWEWVAVGKMAFSRSHVTAFPVDSRLFPRTCEN